MIIVWIWSPPVMVSAPLEPTISATGLGAELTKPIRQAWAVNDVSEGVRSTWTMHCWRLPDSLLSGTVSKIPAPPNCEALNVAVTTPVPTKLIAVVSLTLSAR
jgi:hypothetical protein